MLSLQQINVGALWSHTTPDNLLYLTDDLFNKNKTSFRITATHVYVNQNYYVQLCNSEWIAVNGITPG